MHHGRNAGGRRPDAARLGAPGARRFRAFLRATLAGRPHREPVRALLDDVESFGAAGRLAAAAATGPGTPHHDSRQIEVGSARQAGPGEHYRARALPRTGWIGTLAAA